MVKISRYIQMLSDNVRYNTTRGTGKGMGYIDGTKVQNFLAVPENQGELQHKTPSYVYKMMNKRYLDIVRSGAFHKGMRELERYTPTPGENLQHQFVRGGIRDRPERKTAHMEDDGDIRADRISKRAIQQEPGEWYINEQTKMQYETIRDDDIELEMALHKMSGPMMIRQQWHAIVEKEAIVKNHRLT